MKKWIVCYIIMTAMIMLAGCGSAEYINSSENSNAITELNTDDKANAEDYDTNNVKQESGETENVKSDASENENAESEAGNSDNTGADTVETADIDKIGDSSISESDTEAYYDTELQKYRAMYNEDELTLDEFDDIRADLKKKEALAYTDLILEDYMDLYAYNDRVIGYIRVDGTSIEGPVLQTIEDYEYYLHRDIDGVESEPGCIILDADSEIGIGSQSAGYLYEYGPTPIQLVHGHNMRNGTMFGSLLKYDKESYGMQHKTIYYDSLYEKREYELLCAFYSEIYPEEMDVFKYYDIEGIDTKEKMLEWYSEVCKLALYNIGEIVTEKDELIVLSTCAYQTENGRFAIVGKRK